ncbi:probable WRKY transcription factor 4 [Punica granatum]|uniref:Uncharacterized protein n=2 Tax=Punica granatum TaxID=22663 RepID=A0A2I0IVY6_PUNGR|nr:probable WRKY transcription factor 4 [Punica granatum]PKI47923.1 hypothetical protein CRG98_031707 [Punica granatum]
MADKQETRKPPRPTITLPPRPSMDNFAGLTANSPGPMTLVSSFFSDNYPESSPDFRSFSQLLAGAMNSPLAVMASVQTPLFVDNSSADAKSGDGADKNSGYKQNRPVSLAVVRSPLFTVPPGLSPSGLLSPGFFSCQSPFGMSHQQALAQVTAQAALTQSHIGVHPNSQPQTNFAPEPLFTHEPPSIPSEAPQHIQAPPPSSVPASTIPESSDITSSSIRNEPLPVSVDKPAEDGYNWRKYGQKQVKGCEYPRSYYKCTHPHCPVKKKVERSLDGRITEIVYKGQHNHEIPQPNRRSKEANSVSGSTLSHAKPEVASQRQMGNLNQIESANTLPRRDQELTQATTMQTSVSSGNEEADDTDTITIGDDDEPHPKRRNVEATQPEAASSAAHRTVTEPKIVVQTRSEVDLLDDGYRWRKYGQKVVKGNPHPRSYYKCTFAGCNVRKHVERAAADPKAVITTYEGKHNHGVPGARGNSHATANTNQVSQPNPRKPVAQSHALRGGTGFGNNQRPALLRLKEEEVAS